MDTKTILTDLHAELSRINRAIAALEALDFTGNNVARRGRPPASAAKSAPAHRRGGRRRMSAAGRARIAAAARKMWAERRKAAAPKPTATARNKKVGVITGHLGIVETVRTRKENGQVAGEMGVMMQKGRATKPSPHTWLRHSESISSDPIIALGADPKLAFSEAMADWLEESEDDVAADFEELYHELTH